MGSIAETRTLLKSKVEGAMTMTNDTDPLSPEERAEWDENERALEVYRQAEDSGDEELAKELFAKIPFDVETLQSMKRLHGADWLRKKGINTSRADKRLGRDWLDR